MSRPSAPPPNVRIKEIGVLLWRRYDGRIPQDNVLGLKRLCALADHTLLLSGSAEKTRQTLTKWAPWLPEIRVDELVARIANSDRRWSAEDLGTLFDVSVEEREELGIRTIRPAGFDDARMHELRKAYKAASERERRQKQTRLATAKSKAVADNPGLSDRDKAVYGQTAEVWRSTTEIASAIKDWPEFKPLPFPSVRKLVGRSSSSLVAAGLLDQEIRRGSRRQPVLFVRRSSAVLSTVHARFVSETPGQHPRGAT